jgi:chromate reductase, NAD(P)H dehydrogenase (quinone)
LEEKMQTYTVALIVGSLRRDSLNRRMGQALALLAPPELQFAALEIGDLPLYNQDDDTQPSAPVQRLRREIAAAQALLFVTPEYNRSIPGVLKNAIDHGSRPAGQNAWAGKPAGIVGVSPGAMGTAMAQQHLRNVLACLNVPTLCQPDAYLQAKEGLFDEQGHLGPASLKPLQGWMDRYVAWVKLHA